MAYSAVAAPDSDFQFIFLYLSIQLEIDQFPAELPPEKQTPEGRLTQGAKEGKL
jgi:hypothetical protein